jgi:hypothetical protein
MLRAMSAQETFYGSYLYDIIVLTKNKPAI